MYYVITRLLDLLHFYHLGSLVTHMQDKEVLMALHAVYTLSGNIHDCILFTRFAYHVGNIPDYYNNL